MKRIGEAFADSSFIIYCIFLHYELTAPLAVEIYSFGCRSSIPKYFDARGMRSPKHFGPCKKE